MVLKTSSRKKTYRKRNLLVKHKGLKTRKIYKSADSISSNNYCTITETSQDSGQFVNENTMTTIATTIQNYPRAFAMSKLFRWYRPKVLMYKYIPLYNVYGEGNGSKPEFLYVMNRTGDQNTPLTKNQMLAAGAKPQGFSSTKMLKYRPNLLQVLSISNGLGPVPLTYNNYNIGTVPVYNWVQTYTNQLMVTPPTFDGGVPIQGLPTTNNVKWQGHQVFISTAVPNGATAIAKVYCECVWEFKEPLYSAPLAEIHNDISNNEPIQL